MKKVYIVPLVRVSYFIEQSVICSSFDDNVPIVDGQDPEGDSF